MSLTSKLGLSMSATLQKTVGVIPASAKLAQSPAWAWTDGVAEDQADLLYSTTVTLDGDTAPPVVLNLNSGLTDPLGTPLAFSKVKALIVVVRPLTPPGTLVIGGATTAPWVAPWATSADPAGTLIRLSAGAALALIARDNFGFPVNVTTSEQLQFAHAGGSAMVIADVVIIGASG
jgi:hypothetical protein